MRRIGVLMGWPENDAAAQAHVAAFRVGLQGLGWTEGRNIRFDYRWAELNAEAMQRFAKELIALKPDLILSQVTPTTAALLQHTRTIPIVFALVSNPVGSGFVASLARPGGNATGFVVTAGSLGGKWLEMLKEVAPRVTRAAVLRDPTITEGIGQFAVIQSVAGSVGVDVIPINLNDATELERELVDFAQSANSGLILTASALSAVHRELIITLAARHKLPAVYQERNYAALGGLIFYGADWVDQYRRAAGYVDRILKGEKPADLPVQAPTKYQLVINLKTAKALGIEVPPTLLARADEVIE
jgi:putative ABC transport system substrate-binding protein